MPQGLLAQAALEGLKDNSQPGSFVIPASKFGVYPNNYDKLFAEAMHAWHEHGIVVSDSR